MPGHRSEAGPSRSSRSPISAQTGTAPAADEYRSTRPSKIRLKETDAERAQRVYTKEHRRHARETARISRANGYAVTPPPSTLPGRRGSPESLSPPRRQAASRSTGVIDLTGDDEDPHLETEEVGYQWMGNHARQARAMEEELERQERFAWHMQEELAHAAGDPFASFTESFDTGIRIPARHRSDHSRRPHFHRPPPDGHHYARYMNLRVWPDSGHPPPLGTMDESQYAQYVRDGFARRDRQNETAAEAQRRAAKLQEEREIVKARQQEEAERERKRQERRKKKEEEMKTALQQSEEGRNEERRRWRSRWSLLMDPNSSNGVKRAKENEAEILEIELQWIDVPWPVYRTSPQNPSSIPKITVEDLNKERMREFFRALAADGQTGASTAASDAEAYKKTLREAIRMYHPDRFFGRVLPRVRESEQEMVKEGVELCSRIINDLLAEVRTA